MGMPLSKPFAPDVFAQQCPSRDVLDHLTSRWSGLVLVALRERVHRFSELRRKIGGVSEKMLAQTLAMLEEDGFVDRTVYPEVPPRVEYALTDLGREASERLEWLVEWIEKSLPRVQQARAKKKARLDREKPAPLASLEPPTGRAGTARSPGSGAGSPRGTAGS